MNDDLEFGRHNLRTFGDPGPMPGDSTTADTPADIVIDAEGDLDLSKTKQVLKVETPDGGITISFGSPEAKEPKDTKHFDNLALDIDDAELAKIASQLHNAVSLDDGTRSQWLQDRARGLELLGIKLKDPRADVTSAPLDGMSTVNHPMLLEAVLRFQANALGELLPADGPVKVKVDDLSTEPRGMVGHNGGPPLDANNDDQQADALEEGMNHYLTQVAKEYYPDFDRMLFLLGLGGSMFRKVYNCPIRRRPVSEMVDAAKVIVANAASDLSGAGRVTHEIAMRPSTLKRMQLLGVYRDVSLTLAPTPSQNAVDQKRDDIQGTTQQTTLDPQDTDRTIWEVYCELDLPGFEHKHKGKVSGLHVPYRVTMDKDTMEILEIRRNWEPDDDLCLPKAYFVQYVYVPGLGFYGLGLLHILGNPTLAATAGWREMLDAGMFASFPGFLYAKGAGRQNDTDLRVAPGTGKAVDTQGMAISDAIMPLPYKEPSAALMQLIENIVQTGQRIGGTAEINVGEGTQNAPVGTTIALIEQATKLESAVHKRLHRAQAEEFAMLADRFRDDPEAFWRYRKGKQAYAWDKNRFLQALSNNDLRPAADPNTSSHMMRVMKATALKQIQAQNPAQYDGQEIDKEVLGVLGYRNPERFFVKPEQAAAAPPDPKVMAVAQKAQTDQAMLALKAQDAQRAAEQHAVDLQAKQEELAGDREQRQLDLGTSRMEFQARQMELSHEAQMAQGERQDAEADRALEVAKLHADTEQGAAQVAIAREKTHLDNQSKIYSNDQDNETALEITKMQIHADQQSEEKQIAAEKDMHEHELKHGEKIEKLGIKAGKHKKSLSTGKGLTNNPTPSKR